MFIVKKITNNLSYIQFWVVERFVYYFWQSIKLEYVDMSNDKYYKY